MNVRLEASTEQKSGTSVWIKRIKTQFHTKNSLHLKDCNAIKLLFMVLEFKKCFVSFSIIELVEIELYDND